MASISAGDVKALRDQTGAGMMDCKRALQEADGDAERALDVLRERGLVKARGKSGRATSEGRITASVSDDARRAALVELNCETDFVARTDDFGALCDELAAAVRDEAPGDAEAVLALRLGGETVAGRLTATIARLGENVQLGRFACIQTGEQGLIESYVHAGGKIGALVELKAGDVTQPELRALGHNLCMHVVAASPLARSRDELPADLVESERALMRRQAESEGSGKPPQVIERIAENRLGKYFKDVVLLEQPLVMDPDQSVGKAVEAARAEVVSYERLQLGDSAE